MKINLLLPTLMTSLLSFNAYAIVNYATDTSTVDSIPSLTGFATTGAMMDGMTVSATFSNGATESLAWADTSSNGGGVFGSGWSLTLDGDSFGTNWNFSFTNQSLGSLVNLLLDGSTGFTVFDRTSPSPGTDGSASGWDFEISLFDATVTYLNPVAVIPNSYVGDIWHKVNVDFGSTGPRSDFTFIQDTDNDSRINNQVPEPTTLSLLGLGLLATRFLRKIPKS